MRLSLCNAACAPSSELQSGDASLHSSMSRLGSREASHKLSKMSRPSGYHTRSGHGGGACAGTATHGRASVRGRAHSYLRRRCNHPRETWTGRSRQTEMRPSSFWRGTCPSTPATTRMRSDGFAMGTRDLHFARFAGSRLGLEARGDTVKANSGLPSVKAARVLAKLTARLRRPAPSATIQLAGAFVPEKHVTTFHFQKWWRQSLFFLTFRFLLLLSGGRDRLHPAAPSSAA